MHFKFEKHVGIVMRPDTNSKTVKMTTTLKTNNDQPRTTTNAADSQDNEVSVDMRTGVSRTQQQAIEKVSVFSKCGANC